MSQKQKDSVVKYMEEVGQSVKRKCKLHSEGVFPHYVSIPGAPKEKVTGGRRPSILGQVCEKKQDLKISDKPLTYILISSILTSALQTSCVGHLHLNSHIQNL